LKGKSVFLFSKDAIDTLDEILDGLAEAYDAQDKANGDRQYVEIAFNATEAGIRKFTGFARKDLQVN
jgi:hypothetical protein